ncbi:MAG: hypothetical protein PCFJNLEI_00727 [Verrucomicrobiae bacterium]|nr:hypothetical protein [Verrucomicrobiae bacterium]
MNAQDWWVPVVGGVLGLLSLGFALRAGRRRRLIQDIPTIKTTGVFIGLVELRGTAEAEQPLTSYLAGQPCVHYAWSVAEHWSRTVTETYRDGKGQTRTRTKHESGWKTVASGGEQIPFYLRDDCGVLLIRPAGAKIETQQIFSQTCGRADPLYFAKGPAHAVANSDHRRQFTEQAIPLHAPVYVMGQAREREDMVAAEIASHAAAPVFLISTRTEEQIARGLRWQWWGLGILGGLLTAGGFAGKPPVVMSVAGGYLALWLLAGGILVYNSLINLRQRVRQAWSNVDVQLQRRHDLIPNLVRAVEGLRGHEEIVQATLAQLRAQQAATAPGQPGPDPAGCLPAIRAIAEAYPELTANDAFQKLQEQLTDTENRLALARSYYNDITTFYNTRRQIIPDRFFATLAGLRPVPLLEATDFERAPVAVKLA